METKEQREQRKYLYLSRVIAHGCDNEDEVLKEAEEMFEKMNPLPINEE